MSFELIGIPYSSMARPGGIANAARVLREVGLAERVSATGQVLDAGDLDRGARPLLVGGDCPVLLGPLAAGRDR